MWEDGVGVFTSYPLLLPEEETRGELAAIFSVAGLANLAYVKQPGYTAALSEDSWGDASSLGSLRILRPLPYFPIVSYSWAAALTDGIGHFPTSKTLKG